MTFESTLTPKLIYVMRINDSAHAGCLKIGEASIPDGSNVFDLKPNSSILNRAAHERIDSYTKTAGINYELIHTETTIYFSGRKVKSFNDKEVHDVLLRSGIRRHEGANFGNEWFETDLETVKNAIRAVREGRKSLLNSETSQGRSPIVLRDEQRDAIEMTKKRFKKGNQMLWNAKMRFGKTVSALQTVRELGFSRTLILTHRPVVDDGWYVDFQKIFYDRDDFRYGSRNRGDSLASLEAAMRADSTMHYVYFVSMQDMRGSEAVGGKFDKNHEIFSAQWDFIIIDEAHEGTQTELGQSVIKELKKPKTKVLSLSGTPFNLLGNDQFKEEEIFTWDYVMEQRAKADWDKTHFGDHNPYAGLPAMNIYTYDLGRLLRDYADVDVAFNFREFFRVNDAGRFVHEKDVAAFLNLLCKSDEQSAYPFSCDKYRDTFRHTLWMVPGVKAALALQRMLEAHPVFQHFTVVNVAGDGDPTEEENAEALQLLRSRIGDEPDKTLTITLSCGRLTTGVTVPEWTAVLMLSGSFNTAAASYMQTIFRVQSPATINGRVKEQCYVFDFAPDRTLKVLAETAKISTRAGKTTDSDRQAMAEFLNFCPVISCDGSRMRERMSVDTLLRQLKKVYIERVVNNGFEDGYLYNDNLMRLTDIDIREFDELKGIIGKTKAMARANDITVNDQGLTNEEYEEKGRLEKKKKRDLTEEEKRRLEELKKKKKVKQDAISILRGISIRMPLMIYGADIDDEKEEITIDNFASLIDPLSWEEFMPRGVSKQRFNAFRKYYDPDVFAAAAKRIREMVRSADRLSIEQRIERITQLFATFRNPDKETVLTPWRVVNMHISDTLGGYCFLDKDFKETIAEPRFVDRGKVTAEVFNPDTRILEINSKTGLYPLYMAYSTYRARLRDELTSVETVEDEWAVWAKTVRENIFVVCKTPMAQRITRRTLVGFRDLRVNTRHFEDLINQIKNKPANFIEKVCKGKTYGGNINDNNMKFNAIVGNPPYQVMDGGGTGSSATPVYNAFVQIAIDTKPLYISQIMPAKWYSGGKGLDEFREQMLNDRHISKLVDFEDSRDVFPTVDIAGGICYFLWDNSHNGMCKVVNKTSTSTISSTRYLNEFDAFIRDQRVLDIIAKVQQSSTSFLSQTVYSRKPFGIRSFEKGFPAEPGRNISLFGSSGISYLSEKDIPQNAHLIPKWKLIMSKASAEHAGQTDKEGRKRIVSRLEVLQPGFICTESYLLIDTFNSENEAESAKKYIKTRFVRFLLGSILITQNIVRDKFRFVPLQDFTDASDIDWSQPIEGIDRQLYRKYGLTDDEIAFIESMIKPM